MSALRDLGEYIREQRKAAEISLRQLAAAAGVSNPYLSQIERGLRKPSADILQQIAKALRISSEALYVQAGILDERDGDPTVIGAILGDTGLTERQKHVLLEIYETFRKEGGAAGKVRPATASVGPMGKEPAAPGKADPAKTGPAKADPAETGPAKADPAKAGPAKAAKKAAKKTAKKAVKAVPPRVTADPTMN